MGIVPRLKMKVKGRSGQATGFRKIRVSNHLFYAPAWCAKPVNRIHPSMMCEQMLNDSASASLYVMRSGTDMTEPLCRPASAGRRNIPNACHPGVCMCADRIMAPRCPDISEDL